MAIIIDSGSTDGGPQKLGLGKMTCPEEAYKQTILSLGDEHTIRHHMLRNASPKG